MEEDSNSPKINELHLPIKYKKEAIWIEKKRKSVSYLNSRRIEVDDADLGSNVSQDSQVDSVVEGGVSDQIGGVRLKQIDAIDGDGGDHLSGAVRLLEESGDGGFSEGDAAVHYGEAGLAVPDPDLVGVGGGEEEATGERQGSGGGGIGCDAHVLHPDLLQIELRLLRLHR